MRSRLDPGPYLAGQAIGWSVSVVAEADRPRVATPTVEGALVFAGRVDSRPVSTSSIGTLVRETRRYRYPFWVVPGHAGALRLPPVTARAGERSGTAPAGRIVVRDPPRSGRTRAFLGGVGPLRVSASAEPVRLQLGQELEYRLTLTGPAALGSTRRPDLPGLGGSGLVRKDLAMPDEVEADPPRRVVRWRLRATKVGTVKVPPVPIAHFDPRADAYLTELAPAVAVAVVDVPALDPSGLEYRPQERAVMDRRGRAALAVAGLALGLSLLAIARVRRRHRRPRRVDPTRLALRLSDRLVAGETAEGSAREIADALAEFLRLVARRAPGALTPVDARREFERLTADPDLARRAERMIADCDRARFSGQDARAEELVAEAKRLFRDLAGARFEAGETPGEAPGAAR